MAFRRSSSLLLHVSARSLQVSLFSFKIVFSYLLLLHTFYLGWCRGKRVIELGSGYGLAGLVIAAATEASEVVVSDENPQVVNCLWTVPCLLGFIVVAAELWHVLVAYSSKQVSLLFLSIKIFGKCSNSQILSFVSYTYMMLVA